MSGVPMLVEATILEVLIVGGGSVAARKAARLLDAGASVRVVAPDLNEEMRRMAEHPKCVVVHRRYEAADIGPANLVIAATNDRDVNATVAADARRAHRLVNVADIATEGAVAFMAAHTSGPLTIAVNAGGVPAAAVCIREAIAGRFDARYANALAELAQWRRRLLNRGDAVLWQERTAELFGDAFCEAVESGRLLERVAEWR